MNEITRFQKEGLQSPLPVLVDFFSPQCGPCRQMSPVLDELADELAGKAGIVTVDIHENSELTDHYSIAAVPTMIVFKNGHEVARFVGLQTKDDLIDALGVEA